MSVTTSWTIELERNRWSRQFLYHWLSVVHWSLWGSLVIEKMCTMLWELWWFIGCIASVIPWFWSSGLWNDDIATFGQGIAYPRMSESCKTPRKVFVLGAIGLDQYAENKDFVRSRFCAIAYAGIFRLPITLVFGKIVVQQVVRKSVNSSQWQCFLWKVKKYYGTDIDKLLAADCVATCIMTKCIADMHLYWTADSSHPNSE